MSFRIDLVRKDNVDIFLVIIRDQININYRSNLPSSKENIEVVSDNFSFLCARLELEEREMAIRGANPEHVKRHHVYDEEIDIHHQHMGFNQDVTPNILRKFFKEILRLQKIHAEEQAYQFLDKYIARRVLHAFNLYYQEFTHSALQEQFLEERRLSPDEKKSLAWHAAQKFGTLSKRDLGELQECGHTIYSPYQKLSSFNPLFFTEEKMPDDNARGARDEKMVRRSMTL